MDVSLSEQTEKYIASLVESGQFENVDEAVNAAIQLHEKMVEDLRHEIEKGWDGPPSPRSIDDILADRKKTH